MSSNYTKSKWLTSLIKPNKISFTKKISLKSKKSNAIKKAMTKRMSCLRN